MLEYGFLQAFATNEKKNYKVYRGKKSIKRPFLPFDLKIRPDYRHFNLRHPSRKINLRRRCILAHLAKKERKKKHGPDLGLALWLLVKSETAALGALQKADAGIKQAKTQLCTLTI